MSIKHKFASTVADGDDSTLVRPSNWNDDHEIDVSFLKLNDVPLAYTDMAGKVLTVNETEDGLVFLDPPEEGGFGFIDLLITLTTIDWAIT